jgi:hypothetical protein
MVDEEREKIIKNTVNNLFKSVGIDRINFLRNKNMISNTFEHFIAPIRLSKDEILLPSGIYLHD